MRKNNRPIYIVIGTRAQFIKVAPLMRLMLDQGLSYRLIYTAQHKENIDEILQVYHLPRPDVFLYDKEEANTKSSFLKWFIVILFRVLFQAKRYIPEPGILLTHGDTFTAWLAALMGKRSGCVVGHIESGCRSYNIFSPFPEEISRLITFQLTDIFFCADSWAMDNLKHYRGYKVDMGANTMLDGVRFALSSPSAHHFEFQNTPYVIVSLHRFENIFTSRFTRVIIPLLKDIARDHHLVITLHPTTRKRLIALGLYAELNSHQNITLHERFGFVDWINVCNKAEFVITDGGSNQEELSYLGVPTLLFRNETERREGLEANVVISGFDKELITSFIANLEKFRKNPLLAHAKPSERIIKILTWDLTEDKITMQNGLLSGVPKVGNYISLIDSIEFRKLETFSNNFLIFNKNELHDYYSKKWVKDPLHQWSRQWEYSYVFSRIQSLFEDGYDTKRILDAGSGVTFFPYLIKSQRSSVDIFCIDQDKKIESIYTRINSRSDQKVNFICSDLKELPYERDWFDAIYCISVLEHTSNYSEIIDEFRRILRPGGKLVITFDISLDGTRDVSVENAEGLINSLIDKFISDEGFSPDWKSQLDLTDLFTTLVAKDMDPRLLPWKLPSLFYKLRSILAGKRLNTWPPPLTVFCLTLAKPLG